MSPYRYSKRTVLLPVSIALGLSLVNVVILPPTEKDSLGLSGSPLLLLKSNSTNTNLDRRIVNNATSETLRVPPEEQVQVQRIHDNYTDSLRPKAIPVEPNSNVALWTATKKAVVDAKTTSRTGAENKNNKKTTRKPLHKQAFAQNYSKSFLQSTEPWTNVTSMGYWRRNFYSGFRNQIMAFSALAMWANHFGHDQIVLETLRHKDTHGSSRMLPHPYIFDVEHWNSHYPTVPRLVRCVNFFDMDCTHGVWRRSMLKAKDPFAYGESVRLFANYMRYAKGKGPLAEAQFRNPVDLAILQGALRPHPDIRSLMDRVLRQATNGSDYWTLHPRVEPDMQQHPMCRTLKVTNLTDIFNMLERAFPTPPAPLLFLPINRPSLEEDAKIRKNSKGKKKTNWSASHNLQVLNHAVAHGLWNGTVRVFELGSSILNGTKYENTPSTIGAMMNFEFALQSKVFVGTPVSSWSVDVTASRFYRGVKQNKNFQYLPQGIQPWTTPEMEHAPNFDC
jgi:hypothetical protein